MLHVAPDWSGFVEQTCIQTLYPYLAPGQHTVSTYVEISHIPATPVGMTITATITLAKISGRMLDFRVSCHDAAGLIGEGHHQRAIIDVERFLQKLMQQTADGTAVRRLGMPS